MEFRIDAGVKVDLATPAEVRQIVHGALSGWQEELMRGTKFRHPAAYGIAAAGGALLVDATSPTTVGPAEGFIWSISRITVTGLTAAQTLGVFVNDNSPMMAAGTFTATVNTIIYGDRGLVLNGGDRLVLNGVGLTAGGAYIAACEVTELPVQLRSRFL